MSGIYKGGCFCGAVAFEVSGTPVAEGYCHCADCRNWAAAPFIAFTLWAPDAVRITKGEGRLASYSKSEKSARKFCTSCGGHLMTAHPNMNLVSVYPSQIEAFKPAPTVHVAYSEKVMPVPDGLPKFADVPAEYGGSGEMLAE
jgi:hypothetical protein